MPKFESISQFIHRASQFLIVGLIGIVLYFVEDIHSDIKEMRTEINRHDTKLEVQETKLNFLTGRVDVLSEQCLKK